METNLKSNTQHNKLKISTKDIVAIAAMSAILFVVQITLSFIPNIELVTLLIIVFTLVFERKTVFVIYIFAILEGIYYGFGIWWFMYLYVWTILYFVVRRLRHSESVALWSVVGGFFGIFFGALCSIPYFIAGGMGAGLAWWVAGIPYDLMHGLGNVVTILILFRPIYKVVNKLYNQNEATLN